MANVFITGVNRGIGFGLAKEFHKRGDSVLGVCRTAASELRNVCSEVFDNVDVTRGADIESLKNRLNHTKIDVLINNAGVLKSDSLQSLDDDALRIQWEVNALAPLRVTASLLSLVKDGGKIVVITSRMGSIADNGSGGYYGYRMSKAAVNAAFVSLARDLEPRNISVGILHPGMVATEMTGKQGIPVAESVAGLVKQIDGLNLSRSGRFFHQNGEELPW